MVRNIICSLLVLCVVVGITDGVALVEPYYRCYGNIDLAFLIDGSHSIEAFGCGNFKRVLDFVQRVASGFGIAPAMTRVGVGVYSTFASVPINFKSHKKLKSLLAGVKGIGFPGVGTRTGHALKLMRTHLFSQARKQARKVLIVLTDGTSNDDVITPAAKLRESGVEIFVVGMGEQFRRAELNNMATDAKHVFTAGFKDLMSIEKTLRNDVCFSTAVLPNPAAQGVGAPCYNPCYGT